MAVVAQEAVLQSQGQQPRCHAMDSEGGHELLLRVGAPDILEEEGEVGAAVARLLSQKGRVRVIVIDEMLERVGSDADAHW